MTTDTAPKSPPVTSFPGPFVLTLRKDFTFADDGSTLVIGTIPANALIIKPMSGVHVVTAFNGNSTNTLDVGYSTDTGTDNLATLLALGTTTFVPLDEAVGDFFVTSDTIISMKVTSTSGATTGVGKVVICYVLKQGV